MAKKTSFADQSVEQLTQTEATLRKELFDLKFQHATRNLASSAELGAKRKELARVLTAKNAAKKPAKKD